jgi:hypothetical protein
VVDPQAHRPEGEIVYPPSDQVLEAAQADPDARSFDASGADYTHDGSLCTFEVLIREFRLTEDPALVKLAGIVHAADVSEDLGSDPLAPGLSLSAWVAST